jgi:hypothetical protein
LHGTFHFWCSSTFCHYLVFKIAFYQSLLAYTTYCWRLQDDSELEFNAGTSDEDSIGDIDSGVGVEAASGSKRPARSKASNKSKKARLSPLRKRAPGESASEKSLTLAREMGSFSDAFVLICILKGCDYLEGIHGVGLSRAVDIIRSAAFNQRGNYTGYPTTKVLHQHAVRLCGVWSKADKRINVPPSFTAANVKKAHDCFIHQVVWDPQRMKRVCLNHPDRGAGGCGETHRGMPHCGELGKPADQEKFELYACGEISSITHKAVSISPAHCQPNYGHGQLNGYQDRYIPVHSGGIAEQLVAIKAKLEHPAERSRNERRDLSERTSSAKHNRVVQGVLGAYKFVSTEVEMSDHARVCKAIEFMEVRSKFMHADRLAGVGTESPMPKLQDLEDVSLPNDLSSATKELLLSYMNLFQGARVSNLDKEGLIELVEDVQKVLEQGTYIPRLKMGACDLCMSGTSRPHPTFWGSRGKDLDRSLQPPVDADWLTDNEDIGRVMPSIPLAFLHAHWTQRVEEDNDEADAFHTLERAYRLINEGSFGRIRLRVHALEVTGKHYLWVGYHSLASMRGSYKDTGDFRPENYWNMTLFEVDKINRRPVNIVSTLCECVGGMVEGGCSHAAGLCLALTSMPLFNEDGSEFAHTASTQFVKLWSGDGECTADLSIPLAKMGVKGARLNRVFGRLANGKAPRLQHWMAPPCWLVRADSPRIVDVDAETDADDTDIEIRPGERALAHLHAPLKDCETDPKYLKFLKASRAASVTKQVASHNRREREFTNPKPSKLIPGQLGVDESHGPVLAPNGVNYIYEAEATLRDRINMPDVPLSLMMAASNAIEGSAVVSGSDSE